VKRGSRRTTILVLGILLVALFLAQRMAEKMQSYLGKLDDEISAQEDLLAAATLEIDSSKGFLAKWNAIRGFQDEPVEERQNKFTAYLQSLETERIFYFSSLGSASGRPLESNPDFQVLSYDLSFYADIADLVEFIAQLDDSDKLVRLEKLRISHRKEPQTRYETAFPRTLTQPRGDLWVEMTVSIPAAQPTTDATVWKEAP